MARTDTLEILGEIVDTLEPIGGLTRGTPLRAADWNTVVGAVANLARLVASREATTEEQLANEYAAIDHNHVGVATLSWFEPQTRKLIEEAASGSVERRLGQAKIEREMASLRSEIASLRDDMKQLRVGIDGLRDSDFARERSLGRLGNDVEALKGVEGQFSNLSDRLTLIGGGIEAVLTFRDRLSDPSGQPIDVASLATRVTSLEGLRENLLTASGEVVRIREVEAAIARIETSRITREEVDGLVTTRVRDANLLADAGLLEGIGARVTESMSPRFDAVAATADGLRGDLAELAAAVEPLGGRIDALDGRVTSQASRLDSLAGIGGRVDGLTTRLGTVESGLRQTQEAVAGLPALNESIGRLGNRVDALDATVARVNANTTAITRLTERTIAVEQTTATLPGLSERIVQLEGQTAGLPTTASRLTSLETRVSGIEPRLTANEAQLDTLANVPVRLAALDRSTAELATWRQATETRLTQLSQGGLLNERVFRLEERVADQGTVVGRLSESVEPLRALAPRVAALDSRLAVVERGGIRTGPVLPGGRVG